MGGVFRLASSFVRLFKRSAQKHTLRRNPAWNRLCGSHMRQYRDLLAAMIVATVLFQPMGAAAQAGANPQDVLFNWNRMVLELVRHTPTYSPPVASRSFAYLGVTAYEAVASGTDELKSLAGQLNELSLPPQRDPNAHYDEAAILHAALTHGVRNFFGNTGPTGQRAMNAMESQIETMVSASLDEQTLATSIAYGEAVAAHILEWSLTDGGALVENLGFPYEFEPGSSPQSWVPTSTIGLQQAPLLPNWGDNRTFAMPNGATCPVVEPPVYDAQAGSEFYTEAMEVYEAVQAIEPDEEAIARFWSDDPMLSPTPPGHWIAIALQLLRETDAELHDSVDLFARLGISLADSFIGCWHEKYLYDLLRPVTYINLHIDPDWRPILITPPFPEYPSGHSTQSGAAAAVLEAHFGPGFAFSDKTHERDGLGVRSYQDFWHAAEEAAISRLYGGIHYRVAIESGLDQGRCVGAFTNALVTWER